MEASTATHTNNASEDPAMFTPISLGARSPTSNVNFVAALFLQPNEQQRQTSTKRQIHKL